MESQTTIHQAIDRLSADGFIGYPTETVWGLGACANRPIAVTRLSAWKRRSADQPLTVLVASAAAAIRLGCRIDNQANRLIEAFWPGPMTLVVPCERRFAPGVARSDGALGLRCSEHPIAVSLVAALDEAGLGPLTSTSLNRSGDAPVTDADAATSIQRAGPEVGFDAPLLFMTLASGEQCDAGAARPSMVVDCTGSMPEIIRAGEIRGETLERVLAR